MIDTVSAVERSRLMSRVKGKNTRPEMLIRRLVHGCFWHRHDHCALARMPKSNQEFWVAKLEGNKERDVANHRRLRETGWDVLVIWECELCDLEAVLRRITCFLGSTGKSSPHKLLEEAFAPHRPSASMNCPDKQAGGVRK